MAKLIPLEEAANILGMSAEQLTELRSGNEIFGYRDGANWKFKLTEIQRFAEERGIDVKISPEQIAKATESDLDLSAFEVSDSSSDVDLGSSGSDELILGDDDLMIQEDSAELIQDDSDSADLIQDESSDEMKEDSSVEIFSKPLGDMGSLADAAAGDDDELRLDESGLVLESGEDILDDDDDALSFGSSSLSLAASSSKKLSDSANLLDDEEPGDGDSPSDTGKMLGASGDDLLLSEEDLFSDELSLADSGSFEESADLSSDFEDSDVVIDDSDSSSEIALDSGGSGIKLGATESGISIDEEPLELGGSDIDSLELPEDDDMIVLESAGDPDSATVMQEDDFNLTPLEADPDFESSGSQVIALDDSEIYSDESSATVLGASDEFAASPAMLDDTSGYDMGMGAMGAAGITGANPMAGVGEPPEAPYTMWQILGLGTVSVLLLAGGMVAYDLARNMWMPEDRVISSSVLNFFLQITGMN